MIGIEGVRDLQISAIAEIREIVEIKALTLRLINQLGRGRLWRERSTYESAKGDRRYSTSH